MSDIRTRNATQTSVATSTTSAELAAAGGYDSGLTVYNDSAVDMYLLCGAGAASSTAFTVKLAANAYWEAPFGYSGRVAAVLASSTGNARVTRFA
jgi:hypothetical protein